MESKQAYTTDVVEEEPIHEIDPEMIPAQDLPNFRIQATDDFEKDLDEEPSDTNAIPQTIKQFLEHFCRLVKERNIESIRSTYEVIWGKMSEKYYKNSPWPSADAVSPLVENDEIFMMLYKEMTYRHLHTRISNLTLENRLESWKNYTELFTYLINASPDLKLDLPVQWLWDMVDEFVYQFQFFCQYRAKVKAPEEINTLKANPDSWNVTRVFSYLQSLITKSGILLLLEKEKLGIPEEQIAKDNKFVSHPLYRMLGFFSIIATMRLQCLIGDFHSVLKTVAPIDLFTKSRSAQVTACHVTLYYHVGFAYMVLRRFVDAIKTFSNILVYINRTKQFHTKSNQYEQLIKKNDQIYSLLAICVAVCPTGQRVDDSVHTFLKEKYGEKLMKMQKGEEQTFEELFLYGCPKFVNPAIPNFGVDTVAFGQETLKNCTRVFLNQLKQHHPVPTLRSYLKLYTTLPTQKLADFLEVKGDKALISQLVAYKHKTREVVHGKGPALSGEIALASDVDFYIDQDMIHIVETRVQKRYSEFFIWNTDKLLRQAKATLEPDTRKNQKA